MAIVETEKITRQIEEQAIRFGASLVGMANVAELRKAPSYTVTPLMEPYSGVGANKERQEGLAVGQVDWPSGMQAVVVVAYAHPEEQPELDYWHGSIDPIGNKKLVQIVNALADWLQKESSIKAIHLPYHIERGGIYLKDAAVYAGMGCIGKNNMLVTPKFGPRVRLRGLAIDLDLPSTGIVSFDPCSTCGQPCSASCPKDSFKEIVLTGFEFGRKELPGRDGSYNRIACNMQMKLDEEFAVEQEVPDIREAVRVVKYCRQCEFTCPAGRK